MTNKTGSVSFRILGDAGPLKGTLRDIGNELKGIAAAFAVTNVLRGSFAAFAEFEQGLANVARTTGNTKDQINELGDGLRKVARTTPLALKDLVKISEELGSAGVTATDQLQKAAITVAKFEKATDSMGQGAATSLARILSVTGDGVGKIENFSSSVVQLANDFATAAPEILRTSLQVSISLARFKVGSEQIAAFSAALATAGVQAEVARSELGQAFQAISDAIQNGGKEMQSLQAITGLTGAEIKTAFGKDSADFVRQFVGALAKLPGAELSAALESVGIKGIQAVNVFGALTAKTEDLDSAFQASKKAYAENTALSIAYARQTDTLAAKFEKFKNNVNDTAVSLGKALAPSAKVALDNLSGLLSSISSLARGSAAFRLVLQGLAAVITVTLVGVALRGLALALTAARIGFAGAAVAARAFALALAVNPLTIFATALAGVAVGLVYLADQADKAKFKVVGLINAASNLSGKIAQIAKDDVVLGQKTADFAAKNSARTAALYDEQIKNKKRQLFELNKERAASGGGAASFGKKIALERQIANAEFAKTQQTAQASEFGRRAQALAPAAAAEVQRRKAEAAAASKALGGNGGGIPTIPTGGGGGGGGALKGGGGAAPNAPGTALPIPNDQKSVADLLVGTPAEREQGAALLAQQKALFDQGKSVIGDGATTALQGQPGTNAAGVPVAAGADPSAGKTIADLFLGTAAERATGADLMAQQTQGIVASRQSLFAQIFGVEEDYRNASTAADIAAADARLQVSGQFFNDLITLSSFGGKKLQSIGKALALAQIAFATGTAIMDATAQAAKMPFPANIGFIAFSVARVLATNAQALSQVRGAREKGGFVNSQTPYLVGERGPEVFVPRSGGNIIPNHALGGMGGGKLTVEITMRGDAARMMSARQRENAEMGVL
jgi:TP901 family phage tail tape measure protein